MQLKNNTIAAVSAYFKNKLTDYYDKPEIESMLRIVFSDFFNLSPTDLLLKKDNKLSESEIVKIVYLIKDLEKYKPLAYILGHWEFYGLDFFVNKNTLIPRPETEELVQEILNDNQLDAPKILDIGTGTGCIAIALKKKLPYAAIFATDISQNAIETARLNAEKNQVKVNFICTDIANDLTGKYFDIIVSNPPYISDKEKDNLDNSVLKYEPHVALFSSENPLYFYETISRRAQNLLQPTGKIYFEINPIFVAEIQAILKKNNFKNSEAKKDINGKWRIIKAEKSE